MINDRFLSKMGSIGPVESKPRPFEIFYIYIYIDYLKKFLTDFDETWQDDV